MEQNLKTLENVLKECYLPAWKNQLGVEPTPLLGKIKKVTLEGNKIVATAPIGLSGGFGFGEEGQATPAAGKVNYSRFETYAKDLYVNICISEKAVKLAKGKADSMINALEREIEAGYETAKWNTGRALYGNGTGKLADITTEASGTTHSVGSTAYLKEGLIVDFYAADEETPYTTARIIGVDRVNNKILLDKAIGTDAGFITVQNS